MVPVFSLRSLLSLFIGLVIGAVLGLGYSSFNNNSNAELKAGWPPIQIVKTPYSTLYESTVQGRMMPQVSNDTYLKDMDSQGQYYAAKMNSMPFFEYLSKAVSKLNPQYAETPEELSKMINVTYVTLANNPSVIQIQASFPSAQETLFMLQTIPEIFEEYIQNEQNSVQEEIYQNKANQVEITRTELLQAGQDLVNSTTIDKTPPTTLTKNYIELSAKIATLQDELNTQSQTAANLLAEGFATATSQPQNTPSPTETPSSDTSQPQNTPSPSAESNTPDTNPAALAAQIKALQDALAFKQRAAAGYVYIIPPGYATPTENYNITDAQIDQAYTQASDQIYVNTIDAIENLSTELSNAKVEMDQLQAEVAQEKAADNSANEQKKLEYTIANSQITNLTTQLNSQTADLMATEKTVPPSQTPKFYATEAPLSPLPVNPTKNAPLFGAIFGVIAGWLFINRKWLAGSANKSSASVDEDEEDENPPAKEIVTAAVGNNNDKEEDDEWIDAGYIDTVNNETSDTAIKKEANDWLNAGIDNVSNAAIKKADEEWLNSEIKKISKRGTDTPKITLEGDAIKDDDR